MIFIDTNFKLSHLPFIENKLIITKYFYVSYIIKEIILILKKKRSDISLIEKISRQREACTEF